ncbi:MAG: TlpA family protein disulfide reductase [Solirubrobacteraceae bacterium]
MSSRSRSRLLLALALIVMVVIVGIVRRGQASQSAAPSKPAVAAAFAGSPPVLSALHARAGELVSGGLAGFDAELRALRGQPVVIDLWGSWCAACRNELPSYQRVAVADGRRVAFVGIDVRDPPPAGADLLLRFPLTFPSWLDPHGQIAGSLGATGGYPETVFIGRRGAVVADHSGPYRTAAALQRDVKRLLLG